MFTKIVDSVISRGRLCGNHDGGHLKDMIFYR
jgi:hypothetical protein